MSKERSIWDRLTIGVRMITFGDDKITILAEVPEDDTKEGRHLRNEINELKSWKITNYSMSRMELESTYPKNDYSVVINPMSMTPGKKYWHDVGAEAGKVAFWFNYEKQDNECHKEGCFEFRTDKMKCDLYDKHIAEINAEKFEYGKASLVCWTEEY